MAAANLAAVQNRNFREKPVAKPIPSLVPLLSALLLTACSGGDWLAKRFPPGVSEPVRLHVTAKRYLCAVEKDYFDKLSAASVYTLSQQGGPMSDAEVRAFAATPHLESAVRLRRWDDSGKVTGITVHDLSYYRAMLGRIARV